jgi:predicted RNA-binding protein with PUA-like domain
MRPERKYWLFKSEPTAFSFEDLQKSPDRTACWDGVRNFQARNYLRDEVKPGDGVLFYHSNIPQPHIAGIAVVVREGYPDGTALDPCCAHFDPHSTALNPIWYMVDIRYCMPFVRKLTLEELRRHPDLSGMVLLHRSRLSIQPVTREEWTTIICLGGNAGNSVDKIIAAVWEGK